MRNISFKFASSATAVVAGLILGLYEVTGESMPIPLVITLKVILFTALAFFIGSMLLSIYKAFVQWRERNAISFEVPNEEPGLLDCQVYGKNALNRLSEEFKKWEDDVKKLSTKWGKHSKKLTKLRDKRVNLKVGKKRADKLGKQVGRSANYLHLREKLFEDLTNEIIRNYSVMIKNLGVLILDKNSAQEYINGFDSL